MRRRTTRARKAGVTRRRVAARAVAVPEGGEIVVALAERESHHEVNPGLSGGDVDADWQGAQSSGEEAVGGSVATPDQDVVDEIGRALGVEQELDAEVHMSAEVLDARTRRYWAFERRAAEREDV
jgi:Family of unknown function (DUF6335)